MYRFVILAIFLSQIAFGQTKQMSLEDAVYGAYSYLRPGSVSDLSWRTDGSFTYVEKNVLVQEDVKGGEPESILELSDLSDLEGTGFKRFPSYEWITDNQLLLKGRVNYVVYNMALEKAEYRIDLPEEAENVEFSANGGYVVFTQGDNVYLKNKAGELKQITNDGGNGIVNGKTVHRNEFGITKGIFISPSGKYMAFYRKDESMVSDYPLVDFMTREATYTPVKYPMAGMESHQVKVGIYDVTQEEVRFLNTGEPLDHYLTNISWGPDENRIYLAELNREQNHMQLNAYSVSEGEKEATLLEEKSNTYVEPLFPISFMTRKSDQFLYLSRQDGWFHVYQYNDSGDLIDQLTKGEWEVTNILGWDKKEQSLFFEATKEGPLERHIYKLHAKSGNIEKLSKGAGIHRGVLSPEGSYVIDRWAGMENPATVEVLTSKGNQVRIIDQAADPLEDYALGENTIVTLKTKDGKQELYGRMIKPFDFDPSKKYPVIVYVYGGPHSQLVNKGWHNAARWWQYYMASKGYIAFTLDNRGTNNRGRDFETAIHRQLGVLETEDQMQGVAYLKSLPYVDAERIGVHGWSYGGFMTLNLMLRHPDVFKVGVAGGPVVDWSMYEVMYGERYMDTPQENPDGYAENDMSGKVDQLEGKLMLIHGVQDKTVVMQHSMKFLRECVKKEKQVDFFAYPTHAHNVRGKDRIHLMQKVSEYFFDHLKGKTTKVFVQN